MKMTGSLLAVMLSLGKVVKVEDMSKLVVIILAFFVLQKSLPPQPKETVPAPPVVKDSPFGAQNIFTGGDITRQAQVFNELNSIRVAWVRYLGPPV